jgi:hypothetical protein
MNFNFKNKKFLNGLKEVLDKNAPTIATFGSVIGVGLTIFFMHKSSTQAAIVEEKYQEDIEANEEKYDSGNDPETAEEYKSEKTRIKLNKYVQLIYVYRWALISGIGSAGFAFLSNYLNGRTIAALTGFLALNTDKLKLAAKKGKELLGEDKFKELQESVEREILGERLVKGEVKPQRTNYVVAVKEDSEPEEGLEFFYLTFWGHMYEIAKSQVEDAISEASKLDYLTFNDFRGMLGFEPCPAGSDYCWNAKDGNPFKAHIGFDPNVGPCGVHTIEIDNYPKFKRYGK